MRLQLCMAASMLLCAGVAAHADTISVFNLQNMSGSGNVGTVTIDTTIGSVLEFNVSVVAGGKTDVFNVAPGTQKYSPYVNEYQATVIENGNEFLFEIPVTTLVGYAPQDKPACKNNAVQCDYLANVFNGLPSTTNPPASIFEGNLVLQSPTSTGVTPEPSSIALLGTGLLGVAGVVRRRLA